MSLATIWSALSLLMGLAKERYVELATAGKSLYVFATISIVVSTLAALAAAILAIFLFVSESAGWVCFSFAMTALCLFLVGFCGLATSTSLGDTIAVALAKDAKREAYDAGRKAKEASARNRRVVGDVEVGAST